MTKKRSYLLVVLTWLMLCIVGAIPLFVTGSYNSIVDALFDSVSAITTTGTSLCSDVDHAPLSLSIFRSILSLAGAQCVIITFIYAGFHGEGSFLSKSQAFQNVDKSKLSLEFSMRPFLLIVTIVSIGSSAIAAIILFAGGMPIDQAIPNGIVVALSAFSTSSFAPHSSNLVFYQSSISNNFLAIVMLIGSINFVIYFKAIDNNFKSIFTNKELRIFLIWIVILTIAVTIVLTTNYDTNNWLFYVNSGLVMVVSAATTCGMQTIYPSTLTSVPYAEILIALCLASIVGGLIYSATGGVKVFRMVEMFKAVALSIKQKLVPANVYVKSEIKFSKSQSDFSKLGSFTLIIILLYLISAGTGALAFIIHGNAALPSLLESISYVSNTGFNTGISNINMSIDLKFICMFLMLIARLEFICVFACIFIIITGIISTIKNRFKKTNRKPNKTIAKYVSVILILALCINSSYICYAQAQENDSLDKSSNVSSSAEATFDPQIYSETTQFSS
ncbi:MAG: hypothetical protein MJ189_04710 [Coriobacteriales bacterium]|nr:hypothetical protein [Coriobacteriales bacterium]